jgi:hypothetical protein
LLITDHQIDWSATLIDQPSYLHKGPYVKVGGQWKNLNRAGDKAANTVDFLLQAHRDKAAAHRYFEKAIDRNGKHYPERHRSVAYNQEGADGRRRRHSNSCHSVQFFYDVGIVMI